MFENFALWIYDPCVVRADILDQSNLSNPTGDYELSGGELEIPLKLLLFYVLFNG